MTTLLGIAIPWWGASALAVTAFAGGLRIGGSRTRRKEPTGASPIPQTTALAGSPDDAASLQRELEGLVYAISHDVRAPLRSIDGFSQALLEDYGPQLDATAQGYIERVRTNTRRVTDYIEQLLVLSRLSRAELRVEQVDVTGLVTRLCESLAKAAPGREVEWSVQPGVSALGDRDLLADCLKRLLENAWKFSAGQRPARIHFAATSDGPNGALVFQVRDNGAGFDLRFAGKLFGAFQRMHPPEEYPGAGIGLAAAQRIIHRHRGRIWADTAPGAGATFFFTLQPETNTAASGRNTMMLTTASRVRLDAAPASVEPVAAEVR